MGLHRDSPTLSVHKNLETAFLMKGLQDYGISEELTQAALKA